MRHRATAPARRGPLVVFVAAVVLAGPAVLAGCAPADQQATCVSWVVFDSDEKRAESADAVVVVSDVERDGTASVYGFDAHAYRVTVVESEKGGIAVGETIRVASTADNCAAEPYGDEDPMLGGTTLRLYLDDSLSPDESDADVGDGLWRTLTPFDGVRVVD